MGLHNTSFHQEIIAILAKKIGVSTNALDENYWDTPLTGRHFQLSAVDLVYIFFELEKTLGLRIDEKYLGDYGFSTINEIAQTLHKSTEDSKAYSLA